MSQKKRLPIGIYELEKIMTEHYLYVDKTRELYQLLQEGSYYFLARPRRFGKSLFISTLKELFSAHKKVFETLWIAQSDYEWIEYPVIHIDFSSLPHLTATELRQSLNSYLVTIGKNYSVTITQKNTPEQTLVELVKKLSERNKVVILIDEYDYPILSHLHNPTIAQQQQEILRSFYTVIKSLQRYLHFIFLTGVSKFSKTSIFSGLNNLDDITTTVRGATLLGYTQEELLEYFEPYLNDIAQEQKKAPHTILKSMKQWYNGYQFSRKKIRVYNPYSILLFFHNQGFFQSYWFESGTPSFLINLLKKEPYAIENIEHCAVTAESLGTFEIDNIPLITLLFQTGYLTIEKYDEKTNEYFLNFPNREVRSSFLYYILAGFTDMVRPTIDSFISKLRSSLNVNDIDLFCQLLQQFFATIPYYIQANDEHYYHGIFHTIMQLLGFEIISELPTNVGRIDAFIKTKRSIYIFEFKLGDHAQKALNQIEHKKYYERFLPQGKPIILVGIGFNKEQRNISNWLVKNI